MKIQLLALLMITNITILYSQNTEYKNIAVNDSLMNRIMNYDSNEDSIYVVSELVKLLYSQEAIHNSELTVYIFNPIVINLDEDLTPEIVALLAENHQYAMIVLKEINNEWFVIYHTDYVIQNNEPAIYIANNPSKNKLFYLDEVRSYGSGIFDEGYDFYKIINGKVYNCLNIIKESYISGWPVLIEQNASAQFSVSCTGEDIIWVDYKYEFTPGYLLQSTDSKNSVNLLQGEESVDYVWNDTSLQYEPTFSDEFNNKKIECFEAFGNDSLFVSAYKGDLDNKLKKGRKKEKQIIKKYLYLYKSKGKE